MSEWESEMVFTLRQVIKAVIISVIRFNHGTAKDEKCSADN